jgi:uncharacterized protein involved in exopolysaccharide biosynthesis
MAKLETSVPEISVRDVLGLLFKRKWSVIGLYSAIVVATASYCFFWPPTYEAAVRFLVLHDRDAPVISSDQDGVRMLAKPAVTEDDLNSEVAILNSPAVLEKTVRDLKIDGMKEHWLLRVVSAPLLYIGETYNEYHSKPNASPVARAVERLSKKLFVMPQRKSAILEARLQWGDPEFARTILQRLSENYMAQNLAVHKSPGTQDFFLEQVNLKKAELASVERQIESIRPGANSGAIGLEKQLAHKEATDFEAEWRRSRAEAAATGARVATVKMELQATPERIVTEDRPVINQVAIGSLRSRVLELQLKRAQLLEKYQPQNRLVVLAEQELRSAEAALAEETGKLLHERTTSINKIAQTLQEDLSLNRASLESTSARQRAMKQEFEVYDSRLQQLNHQDLLVQQLDREKRAAEVSLAQYNKRYEEARMEEEMNRTRIVNVVPVEPVWSSSNPVKPNAPLLMKLALGLGLLLAIGFGFLLELMDHRVRNERDVEGYLGAAVLATLDRYDLDELRLATNGVANGVANGKHMERV